MPMERAVSPMPTLPLQGKPLPQYLDHDEEIPAQELKEKAGEGGEHALLTVRRCSICPWLSGTLEQKSEVCLREKGQGRSEVKNKKDLKKMVGTA